VKILKSGSLGSTIQRCLQDFTKSTISSTTRFSGWTPGYWLPLSAILLGYLLLTQSVKTALVRRFGLD